ncbi:hypothetical protein [Thermoproteus uzoniensis]|uniref:hypothetical protein n=1 Tax=Thermoproteus uzoniensis TaxID=184117 RepID=UPI000B24A24C|nr:hypothetical protein [Thermoproteus uzoniensis]
MEPVAVRRAYIEGIAQRRIRYTLLYSEPAPLSALLDRARAYAREIAGEWGASLCPSELPSLGVLSVGWLGGTLLADLSVCFPISRPLPPDLGLILAAEFREVSICLEPIGPVGPVEGFSRSRMPALRPRGVILRDGVAVVKMRGLYFFARAEARPDPAGGVLLDVARLGCGGVDPLRGLLEARRILRRRDRRA